jgi:hypothetical protein
MTVKFTPHPIIPDLLALLEKHNASVFHHGNGSGICISVNGVEVFEGFDGGDLKAAAAQCPPATTTETVTLALPLALAKHLREVLWDAQDRGPSSAGWASPQLNELRSLADEAVERHAALPRT